MTILPGFCLGWGDGGDLIAKEEQCKISAAHVSPLRTKVSVITNGNNYAFDLCITHFP